MFKGLVYLVGLVTLGVAALALAIAYKVHLWPWDRYMERGREFLVEKLTRDEPARSGQTEQRTRHKVQRGETLYAIAAHYYGDGELWPLIAKANSINSPSELRVGDVLEIPQKMEAPCGPGASARHVGFSADRKGLALTPAFEPGSEEAH